MSFIPQNRPPTYRVVPATELGWKRLPDYGARTWQSPDGQFYVHRRDQDLCFSVSVATGEIDPPWEFSPATQSDLELAFADHVAKLAQWAKEDAEAAAKKATAT